MAGEARKAAERKPSKYQDQFDKVNALKEGEEVQFDFPNDYAANLLTSRMWAKFGKTHNIQRMHSAVIVTKRVAAAIRSIAQQESSDSK